MSFYTESEQSQLKGVRFVGLGVAACALVGGLLGEGKVYEAKIMAFMAHVVNACVWVVLAGVLLAPPVRSRFAQSLIGSGYAIRLNVAHFI